jgi:hypothetical protein
MPLYEVYRTSQDFSCTVLVNDKESQTRFAHPSTDLAKDTAAAKAFSESCGFSINTGQYVNVRPRQHV